jgi:hypothetical protein
MPIITTIPIDFDSLCFLFGTTCVNNEADMVSMWTHVSLYLQKFIKVIHTSLGKMLFSYQRFCLYAMLK